MESFNLQSDQHLEKKPYEGEVRKTSLLEIIPGVDISKLSTQEEVDLMHESAKNAILGQTEIGRPQGDTAMLDSFLSGIDRLKPVGMVTPYSDVNLGKLRNEIVQTSNEDEKQEKQKFINQIIQERKISSQEVFEKIKDRFKNQIVVEIGPGESTAGYKFASLTKAKSYVAVDPFYSDRVSFNINNITKKNDHVVNINRFKNDLKEVERYPEWEVIEDDALKLLQALPDNSVSVIMSGISEGVIPDKHLLKINKEIERVLHKEGGLLAVNTYIPKGLLKEYIILSNRFGREVVYIK